MMIKKIVLLMLVSLLCSCPTPQPGSETGPGKVDPYAVADGVLLGAKMLVGSADLMVNQVLAWLNLSAEKKAEVLKTVAELKVKFQAALKVAEEALALAKKAKKGVNVASLFADTDAAWKALREFIASLVPDATSMAGPAPATPAPDVDSLPLSVFRQ